ncbi:helix-turn-helix transcriptional regulator [Anaerotignum propionicum]|uniref:helix-turn-helix domain-containing protein n=1 Tax=Anaerotignum propionicum TaxID=28446 RepID=UPI0028A1FF08|nr:helix-turn-helix transcriptional regulator [Anaerotignum propionicum]
MNERIKEIRGLLSLSQEEFGNRLGVTKAAISKIEKGNRNITEQMIKAICREFRVNAQWLTEGIGEPFLVTPDSLIEKVAEEYNLNSFEKTLMEEYLNLTHEERSVFENFFKNVFQKGNLSKEVAITNGSVEMAEELSPFVEPKLTAEDEKELELIKQEMLAEKKGRTSSASISAKDA